MLRLCDWILANLNGVDVSVSKYIAQQYYQAALFWSLWEVLHI